SAPPPARSDHVALSVILPSDRVLVGAQLDVIAAAWFPRELRTRLRRMPILTLQTPEGVWSYPGASPSEPAASRLVRGGWMDLFVAHQIVFPLPEGRYAYYDRAAGDAAVARAAPRALAVGQGAEPRAARPLPPLDRSAREAWTTALAAGLMPWGWVVLLVGPPLVAWFLRWRAASQPELDPDAAPDAA